MSTLWKLKICINFFLACQKEVFNKNSFKIVSFSQQIATVDPLAVLEVIAPSKEKHFYWETPSQQEAVIGYGTTTAITLTGADRFIQARQFIQNCLERTIRTGDFHLPGANPRFWCSFSFFHDSKLSNSPFPAATIFLPRWQIVRQKDCCILVTNLAIDKKTNIQLILQQIRQQFQKIILSSYLKKNEFHQYKRNIKAKTETELHYKSAVSSALKSIRKGEFSKIVIAHATDVFSAVPFNIIHSLNNLRQRHPDCCIFSTSNGKYNFIGASPERLISIKNGKLETNALAGTAPRGKTAAEDANYANNLLNSKKERREHQAVTTFILQRLQKLGLIPQRSPLQVLQLSNIQHLWTPIYAQMPENVNPLDIVAGLHPTPAVAGVPTPTACEQIRRYENFDRGLYAAPLGWIDYESNSHFIVGIRSALIEGNQARLYAGAGIVAGSDPDKEYAEVQLKLQSLLKALV